MIRGTDDLRFYIDPTTGQPHIYEHEVTEEEVEEVLASEYEDQASRADTRIATGQTMAGRYLRIAYRPINDSVLVITAFELKGKPLVAFRRRRRRSGRR